MDRVAPLVQELSPCPNPWDTAQRFANWPHLLFLDSADRHPDRGRYSFVGADPVRWHSSLVNEWKGSDPFEFLDRQIGNFSTQALPELPPFQGGCAGVFGYGLCQAIERIPAHRIDEFGVPDLAVGFYDWVIAFDHFRGRAWLISTGYPEADESARIARARDRLNRVANHLEKPITPAHRFESTPLPYGRLAPQFPLRDHQNITSNFEPAKFMEAIRRAREYIHAGDCFQANISQRLLAPCAMHALELYGRLRQHNPAPFAAYLNLGEFAIVSASPERFLQVAERNVETRPIKGTRPRGSTLLQDEQRIAELAESAKDRAENIMIVDLLRNDLGRVCEFGSVRVPRVCDVETYRFVHHLVSTVVGKLRPDKTPIDLLRAAFPGGSVTGAPKVRAMEIIAELEPTARGPYCGSLGYIGFDGTMDTNILIRTFTVGRGWVQFPVGGGIVADSDPQREYEETLHKAQGLLQALEE